MVVFSEETEELVESLLISWIFLNLVGDLDEAIDCLVFDIDSSVLSGSGFLLETSFTLVSFFFGFVLYLLSFVLKVFLGRYLALLALFRTDVLRGSISEV